MTIPRTVLVALTALVVGVAIGRTWTGETHAAASASTRTPTAAVLSCSCQAERVELALAKAQLGTCLSYTVTTGVPTAPTPTGVPTAPAEPEGIDAIAAMLPRARARREGARELTYVEWPNGRVKSYLPDEWPPDGGLDGGRITLRKLPDGTWESYDPPPQIVGWNPPGPDGLATLPDGMRIRYVFTDGGAP